METSFRIIISNLKQYNCMQEGNFNKSDNQSTVKIQKKKKKSMKQIRLCFVQKVFF